MISEMITLYLTFTPSALHNGETIKYIVLFMIPPHHQRYTNIPDGLYFLQSKSSTDERTQSI